jgi:hypothetical protein
MIQYLKFDFLSHHLSGIAYWVMKQTFFKHFVAGETLEETVGPTDKLKKYVPNIIKKKSL